MSVRTTGVETLLQEREELGGKLARWAMRLGICWPCMSTQIAKTRSIADVEPTSRPGSFQVGDCVRSVVKNYQYGAIGKVALANNDSDT